MSKAHQPTNIAVSSNHKGAEDMYRQWLGTPRSKSVNNTSNGAHNSNSNTHHTNGAKSSSSSSASIYDHLHHTPSRTALTSQPTAEPSFKPTLPTRSNKILAAAKKAMENTANYTHSPSSAPLLSMTTGSIPPTTITPNKSSEKSMNKSLSLPALVDLSTYVNMPVATRLASVQRDQVITSSYKLKQRTTNNHNTSNNNGNSSTIKKTQAEMTELISRLQSYKIESEQRRYVTEARLYTKDSITKQPLFKPHISPLPSSLYNTNRNGHNSDLSPTSKRRSQSAPHLRNSTGHNSDQPQSQRLSSAVDYKYHELLEKDNIRKQYIKSLIDEYDAKELIDLTTHHPTALPKSMQILQNSTESSIEDMYKLLITSTQSSYIHNNGTGGGAGGGNGSGGNEDGQVSVKERMQVISQMSHENERWRECLLDLSLVDPEMMIDEVHTLILQVKEEFHAVKAASKTAAHQNNKPSSPQRTDSYNRSSITEALYQGGATSNGGLNTTTDDASSAQDFLSANGDPEHTDLISALSNDTQQRRQALNGTTASPAAMIVNYTEFRRLVYRCLRRRDMGKNYVFAPRKRPEVALQMVRTHAYLFPPTQSNIPYVPYPSSQSRTHTYIPCIYPYYIHTHIMYT